MKKIIFRAVIILLIGNLLISSYFIYKELKEDKDQSKIFGELIEDINQVESESNEEITIDLNNLYEINNDLVGLIRINNTDINYPVVKSADENYYLRRNFYKEYSYFRYTIFSK